MNTIKGGLGGQGYVPYQTVTMDSGMLEVLYEGWSLDAAGQSAIAYKGECSIRYFNRDGSIKDVMDFSNGQATKGYVYE